ncbi:MAG: response regulator [Bacteroidota bacterium]|nr:response regulator [Bacteroidota bacterium]
MKKRVLIYDDDLEILAVCKIILEQQNYLVETRPFCDNIIEDTFQFCPGIILMDLWIPAIGGEAAIALLNNHKKSMQIPVILFSANTDVSIIAQRSNASGFLKKPFEITAFLNIIKSNIIEYDNSVK